MSTADKRLRRLDSRVHGDVTVYLATRLLARTKGLALMDPMPDDTALWIARTKSVHTMGMRFPLDLVWLDRDGTVVQVDHDVARRRQRACRKAKSVCETPAGQGDRLAAALAGAGAPPWR